MDTNVAVFRARASATFSENCIFSGIKLLKTSSAVFASPKIALNVTQVVFYIQF